MALRKMHRSTAFADPIVLRFETAADSQLVAWSVAWSVASREKRVCPTGAQRLAWSYNELVKTVPPGKRILRLPARQLLLV